MARRQRMMKALPSETRQKPSRLNLTVDIRDFGPIAKASISLKPLTIFSGPNNSGKSYAALLIHSIVSAHALPRRRYRLTNVHYARRRIGGPYDITSSLDKISNLIKARKDAEIPGDTIETVAREYLESNATGTLKPEIERNFGDASDKLVRTGKRSFSVKIVVNDGIEIRIHSKKNAVVKCHKIPLKQEITFQDARLGRTLDMYSNSDKSSLIWVDPTESPKDQSLDVFFHLINDISKHMGSKLPSSSYYLPAARSGILQGHRAITSGIVSNVAYAGVEGMTIPTMPGAASDFISSIIEMPSATGPFSDIARSLEETILDGKISHTADARTRFPTITYDHNDSAMSLHRTSSTVSELATLVLYLKHVVREGDLVILEEPEAHLHPEAQMILAHHIVKMIRRGLNVLITTHSLFVQSLLGQFLMSGKDNAVTSKKLDFDRDDYLLEDEVAPYTFAVSDEGGSITKPTKFSADNGISLDEFVKVIEKMHRRRVIIEQNAS